MLGYEYIIEITKSLPCVRGGVKAFGFDGGVVGNE